jgi:hypothetical protein
LTTFDAPFDASFDENLQALTLPVAEQTVAAELEEKGSFLSRALAAFLQPSNIKWLLIAGVLILLASSLMLVSTHWHSYAPTWKYLILLGYAGGVGVAGRIAIKRLILPRTGGVLIALAALLMPVTFLGLNLVGRTGPPVTFIWPALLALNAVIAFFTACTACRHFLRQDQPTFLAAYLALSAAGAFVAIELPVIVAAATALVFWAIFAIGAMKVNRHCFWLVEERKLPRILGFLPILLLGGQFLTLCLLGPANKLPVAWAGFGLALVAAVLLATADSIARVFQQRTGDLVRPIPWPIIAPIVIGVTMTFAGLILSGVSDIDPYRPYALVPTALVATVLMSLTAHRTNKQAFVWAALFIATAAYNFSPLFFADAARMIVSQGAVAVSESRLPLPFYGLTYLPLLAGLLIVGGIARRRGRSILLTPIREYSFVLAAILLVASFGHFKATFPVTAVMVAVYAAHAAVFSDRRSAWAATIALLSAAYGLSPFARGVLFINLPEVVSEYFAAIAAGGLLLLVSRRIDPLVGRLTYPAITESVEFTASPCRYMSIAASTLLAAIWITVAPYVPLTPMYWAAGAAIAALLTIQAVVWVRKEVAVAAVVFIQILAGWYVATRGITPDQIISLLTAVVLGQCVLALLLRRLLPTLRLTRAMEPALHLIASIEMYALLIGVHLPANWLIAIGAGEWLTAGVQPSLLVSAILIGWGCDVARRAASPALAAVCCVELLGLAGAAAFSLMGSATWLIPTLAATSVLLVAFAAIVVRRSPGEPSLAIRTFAQIAAVPPVIAMALSLISFTLPAQIGGILAAAALMIAARLPGFDRRLQWTAAFALNWQAILFVLASAGDAAATSIGDLRFETMVPAGLYVSAIAAASLLLWEIFAAKVPAYLCRAHQSALSAAVIAGLLLSLSLPGFATTDLFLAVMPFGILTGVALRMAIRYGSEAFVWEAIAVLFGAALYLVKQHVIPFGHGWSLYVPMIAAAICQIVAKLARRSPAAAVLDRPFRRTAVVMPMATVIVAILRHLSGMQSSWLGSGSLAMLLAAGFYFYRGIERRDGRMHVLAAAIVNVALGLLWRELQLTDPQFYLVPLGASVLLVVQALRREIPVAYRDPLRYAGALMILVSPTFHIVGGSWIHLLSLMLLSVGVMLAGIGTRVRAMLYAGAAFLAADLVAIVVRGGIDQPSFLWLAGLAVGAGVITIAALAERNRENLLQRLRSLSAALAQWQ